MVKEASSQHKPTALGVIDEASQDLVALLLDYCEQNKNDGSHKALSHTTLTVQEAIKVFLSIAKMAQNSPDK